MKNDEKYSFYDPHHGSIGPPIVGKLVGAAPQRLKGPMPRPLYPDLPRSGFHIHHLLVALEALSLDTPLLNSRVKNMYVSNALFAILQKVSLTVGLKYK